MSYEILIRGSKKKTQIYSGRWHPIKKDGFYECCKCGMKHLSEFKVDKQGKLWVRMWI